MSVVALTDSDILNPEISLMDKMKLVGSFAGDLKEILTRQEMVVPIKDKQYVLAEGWSLVGQMLGAHVGAIEIHETPSKYQFCYECTIELHNKDGQKIGEGKAIANSKGFQKEQHTVYSMAQTRALGKAYRLNLAWLIKMAGFEPTPYEEMPESMTEKNDGSIPVKGEEVVMPKCIESAYRRIQHKGVPVTKESISNHVNWKGISDEEKELAEEYIEQYCPKGEE